MKKIKYLLLSLGLVSPLALGFTMPSAPSQVNSTYDEIRTSDGATCRTANGGNFILHGGVSSATGSNTNTYSYDHNEELQDENESGVYMGFAYSIGGGNKIDCTRLANIEFEKAELELIKLRAEIKALKKMNVLNSLPPL